MRHNQGERVTLESEADCQRIPIRMDGRFCDLVVFAWIAYRRIRVICASDHDALKVISSVQMGEARIKYLLWLSSPLNQVILSLIFEISTVRASRNPTSVAEVRRKFHH